MDLEYGYVPFLLAKFPWDILDWDPSFFILSLALAPSPSSVRKVCCLGRVDFALHFLGISLDPSKNHDVSVVYQRSHVGLELKEVFRAQNFEGFRQYWRTAISGFH